MQKGLKDKLPKFLRSKCLTNVNFDIVDVPALSRIFNISMLGKDTTSFVPLISADFDPRANSDIWKQWQSRNSYPKYYQKELYAHEPEYGRDIAFGKPAPANDKVGPRAYLDLSAALRTVKAGSYVYVGLHSGTYVPAHDNKSVLLKEPVFLLAVLLRLT